MAPGKTRITMMLDNDVLKTYREQAEQIGKGYQTLINDTLRAQAGLKTIPSIPSIAASALETLSVRRIAERALVGVADQKWIADASVQSMVGRGIDSMSQEDLTKLAGRAASVDYKLMPAGFDADEVMKQISAIDSQLQAVKKAVEPLAEMRRAFEPLEEIRNASKLWSG